MCACDEECGDNCLNKMLQFECDSTNCPFGNSDCGNRSFDRLKQCSSLFYGRAIEIITTDKKGYGLRACRAFAPGELICEYTGDVISSSEVQRRLKECYSESDHYYFLSLEKGAVIDSGLRGSAARFVNHSCSPNCEMQKWFVKGIPRVGLFAGEDGVKEGTELSYDYNFVWFDGAEAQSCHCGSEQCRGIIGKRINANGNGSRSSSATDTPKPSVRATKSAPATAQKANGSTSSPLSAVTAGIKKLLRSSSTRKSAASAPTSPRVSSPPARPRRAAPVSPASKTTRNKLEKDKKKASKSKKPVKTVKPVKQIEKAKDSDYEPPEEDDEADISNHAVEDEGKELGQTGDDILPESTTVGVDESVASVTAAPLEPSLSSSRLRRSKKRKSKGRDPVEARMAWRRMQEQRKEDTDGNLEDEGSQEMESENGSAKDESREESAEAADSTPSKTRRRAKRMSVEVSELAVPRAKRKASMGISYTLPADPEAAGETSDANTDSKSRRRSSRLVHRDMDSTPEDDDVEMVVAEGPQGSSSPSENKSKTTFKLNNSLNRAGSITGFSSSAKIRSARGLKSLETLSKQGQFTTGRWRLDQVPQKVENPGEAEQPEPVIRISNPSYSHYASGVPGDGSASRESVGVATTVSPMTNVVVSNDETVPIKASSFVISTLSSPFPMQDPSTIVEPSNENDPHRDAAGRDSQSKHWYTPGMTAESAVFPPALYPEREFQSKHDRRWKSRLEPRNLRIPIKYPPTEGAARNSPGIEGTAESPVLVQEDGENPEPHRAPPPVLPPGPIAPVPNNGYPMVYNMPPQAPYPPSYQPYPYQPDGYGGYTYAAVPNGPPAPGPPGPHSHPAGVFAPPPTYYAPPPPGCNTAAPYNAVPPWGPPRSGVPLVQPPGPNPYNTMHRGFVTPPWGQSPALPPFVHGGMQSPGLPHPIPAAAAIPQSPQIGHSPEMVTSRRSSNIALPPIGKIVDGPSHSSPELPPPRPSIGKPGEPRRLSSVSSPGETRKLPLPTPSPARRFYGPVSSSQL